MEDKPMGTLGQYTKLRLNLVDEGRFVEAVDADLVAVQEAIVKLVQAHGELAEKTKASVVIKVELTCESAKDFMFGIKTTSRVILPPRPATVSLAIGEEDERGPSLFVRKSGSSASTPRQGKLATDDGKAIDPETGEIKEDAPADTA